MISEELKKKLIQAIMESEPNSLSDNITFDSEEGTVIFYNVFLN